MPIGRTVLLHAGRAARSGAPGVRALPELFVVPPVVIYEWISADDDAERERRGKGEYGKEEHLKRSHSRTLIRPGFKQASEK